MPRFEGLADSASRLAGAVFAIVRPCLLAMLLGAPAVARQFRNAETELTALMDRGDFVGARRWLVEELETCLHTAGSEGYCTGLRGLLQTIDARFKDEKSLAEGGNSLRRRRPSAALGSAFRDRDYPRALAMARDEYGACAASSRFVDDCEELKNLVANLATVTQGRSAAAASGQSVYEELAKDSPLRERLAADNAQCDAVSGRDPVKRRGDCVLGAQMLLGAAMASGAIDETDRASARLVALSERLLGGEDAMTRAAYETRADLLVATGRLTEADQLLQKRLARTLTTKGEGRDAARLLASLADLRMNQQRLGDALALADRAAVVIDTVAGPSDADWIDLRFTRARLLLALGRTAEMMRLLPPLKDALAQRLHANPQDSAAQGLSLYMVQLICEAFLKSGQGEAARSVAKQLLGTAMQKYAMADFRIATPARLAGDSAVAAGQPAEAEQYYVLSRSAILRSLGARSEEAVLAGIRLGDYYLRVTKDAAAARAAYAQSGDSARALLGRNALNDPNARTSATHYRTVFRREVEASWAAQTTR